MKLIEKLANTYGNEHWHYEFEPGDIADAYEAGFRKAKELLRSKEPLKNRSWFEIPMAELEQLGEEEVGSDS